MCHAYSKDLHGVYDSLFPQVSYTPELMTHDDTLLVFSVGHALQIDQFKPTELASTA